MSKIDKKIKLFSTDIYQFSKDPFRNAISVIKKDSGDITLNPTIRINEYREAYNNLNIFSGYFEFDCGSKNAKQLANTLKPILNIPIQNTYIVADKHYEINEEMKKAGLQNASGLLKFESKFTYNYLSKNYETYLNSYPNLLELNYPYFYGIMNEIYASRYASKALLLLKNKFNLPQSLINTTNIRNNLKKITIPSKILFQNTLTNFNNVFNTLNADSNYFPFYSSTFIDLHQKPLNNISDLFADNNIYGSLLNYSTVGGISQKLATYERGSAAVIKEYNKKYVDSTTVDTLIAGMRGKSIIFLNKFTERMLSNNVKFRDVLYGAPNYSEVIGYVLNKYDTFGPKSSPIQQILFPNTNIGPSINYIDTQLKYNKKYRYSVDLLVMNIDMVYKYTFVSAMPSTNTLRVQYSYEIKPNILLINNSAEYTNKIMSSPPVKPYVEHLPYVNTPNKLKFIVYNNNIQNIIENPISIQSSDAARIQDIVSTQNRTDGKVAYNFDDGVATKFEVYRSTEKPTSYNDLGNKLYKVIETKDLENMAFEDDITPEKYYYYTFRAIDYHEQFSNPTEIYEIVHTNGVLSMNTVSFDVPQEDLNKTFRRFIQVSPSLAQLETVENSLDAVRLGINKESVWDKKFKVRLTSRSTGKKIDFNLTFKYNVRDN